MHGALDTIAGVLTAGRCDADTLDWARLRYQHSMPAVHRVASLLKRWLLGTHQGSVSDKHLDYYLDEYTFRFNRRCRAG